MKKEIARDYIFNDLLRQSHTMKPTSTGKNYGALFTMAILISNDDGIEAPGLAALADALAPLDAVCVSAPSENKSGVGMAITLGRELQAARHPDAPCNASRHSIDGNPADAVKYGLQHVLAGNAPRLVASGINLGPNLGVNIRCSGTLGAAYEAACSGIPALAVSVEYSQSPNWEGAKFYARKMAERLLALPRDHEPFVLNLNVPSRNPEDIKGLVTAPNGVGGFRDFLKDCGGDRYKLDAAWIDVGEGSDCAAAAFNAGYAVITPLKFDLTHKGLLETLSGWDGVERFKNA